MYCDGTIEFGLGRCGCGYTETAHWSVACRLTVGIDVFARSIGLGANRSVNAKFADRCGAALRKGVMGAANKGGTGGRVEFFYG